MDFLQALRFPFDDEKFLAKIIPLALFTLLALIPVVGLFAFAVALGFLIQVAANVRDGLPTILPEWSDLGEKFMLGGRVLVAVLLYNLPLVFFLGCAYTMINGLWWGLLGDFTNVFIACCSLPFLLLYTPFAWSLLAIAIIEYIDTDEYERFYRIGHLWDVLQTHRGLAVQWFFYVILANLLIVLSFVIPCAGWLWFLALAMPLQGHLLGQFGRKLSATHKPMRRKASAALVK